MSSLNPTKRIGDQIAEAITIHEDVRSQVAMRRTIDMLGLVGSRRRRNGGTSIRTSSPVGCGSA